MATTEKKRREFEILKTTADYLEQIEIISDASDGIESNHLDAILNLLSAGLYRQIRYKIKISAPYSRRQGLFSKLKDWRLERKELKEGKLLQKKTQEEDENKQELAKSHQALQEAISRLTRAQKLLTEHGMDISLLAPPEAESEAQNEPSDAVVLEEDKSDTEDGCLPF